MMKICYDDLIETYKSDYFKALETIKQSLLMGSNIDDLELLSFDVVPIDELFESCGEQFDRQLFYNTKSLEKIILLRETKCTINYNLLSHFVKTHFSIVKDLDHSWCSKEIPEWQYSCSLENIGLVSTFITLNDDLFFVVVPFKSVIHEVLVA